MCPSVWYRAESQGFSDDAVSSGDYGDSQATDAQGPCSLEYVGKDS